MSPIKTQSLKLEGRHQMFINDHLTGENKMLLTNVKTLAKARDFQYVWAKHAKILVCCPYHEDGKGPLQTSMEYLVSDFALLSVSIRLHLMLLLFTANFRSITAVQSLGITCSHVLEQQLQYILSYKTSFYE